MTANPPEDAGRERPALVVPVAPVTAGRTVPMPLRVVVFALVIGVIGFLGGANLGAGPVVGIPEPTAVPSSPLASPSPSSAATVSSPGWRGLSDFAFNFAFRPARLIAGLPGGAACVTRSGAVPGHTASQAGRTLVVVWLSTCTMQPSRRAPFLGQLLTALEREIPNPRANTSREEHGISVTDVGYTQGASTGTVTLVADPAGPDLVISITLEEPVLE